VYERTDLLIHNVFVLRPSRVPEKVGINKKMKFPKEKRLKYVN